MKIKDSISLILTRVLLPALAGAAVVLTAHFFSAGPLPAPDIKPLSVNREVKAGDTLSAILPAHGLSGQDIADIGKLLKKNAGSLVAGRDVVKVFGSAADNSLRIIIQSGPWKQIEFARTGDGWACDVVPVEKEVVIAHKRGEIRAGDSFYLAGGRADIPEPILADAYDLLAFEMDFERDIREGQQFSIIYEENYADGKFVNTGPILALSFDAGRRGVIRMYRYGKGYYDENGGGAIKSLKRTPINNARVTSSFSGNRMHPILGFSRAHRGVDFRAAAGTPIPSAGSGRVVEHRATDSYGNYIRIRHNATYETLYAHLSRFQPGVAVGSTVRQGQIVGYVGATGLASGPHLHYEIIKNGQRVNPMTVKLPAIANLPDADKEAFLDSRVRMDRMMDFIVQNPFTCMAE